jgi:hypothetical protein
MIVLMRLTLRAENASAKKNAKQQTAVNMEELVGNTDGFADSGYCFPK